MVICLLIALVELIPRRINYTAPDLAELMFENVYKHHGLPKNIISDRDVLFTSCYNFSYFALFTYDFSLFLEVSHGAAALTHFSLTHTAATLLTHCTAVVLTHSIAILIALPHWCSIYSGQSCRLFLS